jgi:hypothetical protein
VSLRVWSLGCAIALLGTSAISAGDALAASRDSPMARLNHSQAAPYPIGVFDLKEPSYFAPPGANALPGYTRSYVNDFTQQLPSSQWFYFRGIPEGDPSGRFDKAHVAVTHGLLKIGTWRDPRFGNQWVSGGVGLYGMSTTYGAYFVRSRETAPGPDTTELLWPRNNQWPPEIDFNETGAAPSAQSWFVHYNNSQDQLIGSNTVNIEHWHTWGVIWTPTSITFTVDGRAWGTVTAPYAIPNIPMSLDLQSQSWCGITGEPCPTTDSVLLVDWVTQFTQTAPTS